MCDKTLSTTIEKMMNAIIEIEWVFEYLKNTPYEPLHEEEKGIVGDVVVNKKVNALSESLVNFYKQGTMTNMELLFLFQQFWSMSNM